MTDLQQTFDAVIVGAGPAGCVLANRLSEESDKRVLLVEAGPDVAAPGTEHADVLDPFCLTASANSAFHWPDLRAETHTGDATRAPRPFIQGYGVGGASNINGMGVDRGLPGDYEGWRALGATDWGWEQVLPYFKKLERDLDFPTASQMHGDSGPMPVRRMPRSRWAPFAAAVGKALQRRGFPFLEDYTADFRDGFSTAPTSCLPDRRMSASMAYLTRDVRRRPNLTILAHAEAVRVMTEGQRAVGALLRRGGETVRVSGREVILACGAILSPTLLMRSGIGPLAVLSKHGVPVVRDLPGVGANLQNHPSIALTTYLAPSALQPPDNRSFLQNWLRFSSNRTGCHPSDMHLMVFNKSAWHALGERVGAVVVSVLKPYSTGRVELASADPARPPTVRFDLRADPRDFERLAGGLRFALELLCDPLVMDTRREIFVPNDRLVAGLRRRSSWNRFRARAMTKLLDRDALRALLLARARMEPAALLADDAVLRKLLEQRAGVQYHVCGTCRMGRAGDASAVVDSAGRVQGIAGLRVADASIFPTIPRGYTHFIVLMAAEKMADAVKADWRAEFSHIPEAGERA
jgi:5-(hydroxymethyl)furfural/furfural oxidase